MSKLTTSLALFILLIFTTYVFAMDEEDQRNRSPKHKYALAVGDKGAKRLKLQHELQKPFRVEHYKKAGFKEGQTLLDLGCGTGEATIELAKIVGPTGHVHAFDISQEQLDIAKEAAEKEGLTNITFHIGDIKDIMSLKGFHENMLDGIYISFVLAHLSDPEQAIAASKGLLKDGGVLACQDVEKSTTWDSHNDKIFQQYRGLVEPVMRLLKCDYDIGKRLKALHEKAGLVVTEDYSVQQRVNLDFLKLYLLLEIPEWEDKVVQMGFITREDIEIMKETVRNWPKADDTFTMNRITYVVARKAE
jgi:ubiquinone/menaquinone biosynthesis C-methylase UbiE